MPDPAAGHEAPGQEAWANLIIRSIYCRLPKLVLIRVLLLQMKFGNGFSIFLPGRFAYPVAHDQGLSLAEVGWHTKINNIFNILTENN